MTRSHPLRTDTSRRACNPRRLALCAALALAFAAPLSPASGATVIELTPDTPYILFTPVDTDLGSVWGDVVYQGLGRFVKTGAGAAVWGWRSATFALMAGSWIDVLEGSMVGGSSANEDWSRNQASLHVAQGALFDGVEANVRVDALTGAGTIRTGFFDGQTSHGYQTFTLGVANGSGSFAGVLADANSPGHFTKAGSGTQVLTGNNSYTGGTRVAGGTLALGDGGTSGSILGPVQVEAGATLAFNRSDNTSFAGLISGDGRLLKQGSGTLSLSQGLTLRQGLEIQAGSLELQAGASQLGPLLNQGTLSITGDAELTLRDGVSGKGSIEHQGRLLSLSGSVQADVIQSERDDWENMPSARLLIGEAGRSSDVNVQKLVVYRGSQVDITGPETRVFWQAEGDTREGELYMNGGRLTVSDGAKLSRRIVWANAHELIVRGPGSLIEIIHPSYSLPLQIYDGSVVVEQGGRLVTSGAYFEPSGQGRLLVQGEGSSAQIGSLFSHPRSQIQVLAGGLLASDNARNASGVYGQFTISGAGSRWLHDDVLRGTPWHTQLDLLDGGLFRAKSIQGEAGRAPRILLDGGVLELTQAGGSFVEGLDWRQGRVVLGASTALNRDVLPQTLSLTAGRQLEVQGDLQLNSGDRLVLQSGGQLQARQLVLAGGSFDAQLGADFRSVLNWQQGDLTLRGHAELGQGLLAGLSSLDAQRSLTVVGSLSSAADAPTLTLQDGRTLHILGDLQLHSELALASGSQLRVEGGAASIIQGKLSGNGGLRLDDSALSLRGQAELAKLEIGSNSALRLEGPGSELQLQGTHAFAGYTPHSSISVLDGASFRSHAETFYLAGYSGAEPQVLISGAGSRFAGNAQVYFKVDVNVEKGGALQASHLDLREGSRLQAKHADTRLDIARIDIHSRLDLSDGAQLQGQQAYMAGGEARLSGAATRWTLSDGLFVPMGGGKLQVLDGATLHSKRIVLDGGTELLLQGGTLRLDQAENTFVAGLNWSHGQLTIGSDTGLNQGLLGADLLLADGRSLAVEGQFKVAQGQSLQLAQGGQLQAQQLLLAGGSLRAPNQGRFTGNLDWQRGSLSLEGNAQQGQGLLSSLPVLGPEHKLRVAGRLTLDGGTPLVLGGGQLDLDALGSTPGAAALDWRSGSLTLRGDAHLADGLPAQLLLSADKRLHVAGQLSIDRGSQLLLDGGVLSFAVLGLAGGRLDLHETQALSGTFDWQEGTLAFKGDMALSNPWLGGRRVVNQGRVLEVAGQLQLGSEALSVTQGGVLVAGGLQGQGRVQLDGGMLRTASFSADSAARLAWQSGTLAITGDAGAALGQGGFKRMTVLNDGQTLQVSRTLSLARGTQLVLNGGQVAAGTLALQGGTLMTSEAPIRLDEVRTLQGQGLVSGAVQGGARTRLIAQGGTLTLGDANLAGGFAHAGELRVEHDATALLLSADAAQLGSLTELQAGARLITLNGAQLTQGGVLSFQGDATVQGEFIHQGHIEGTGGTLSFLNDVQGAGSFAGSVQFKAGYQPGNSPASIDFGGGRLSFGEHAVLTLEFFGAQPGSGYDQLLNIAWMEFNGTLNLQFDSSFKPLAGSRFQVFDFTQFSGSLRADRITVTGLDRGQLDLSQLGSSGQLLVTAVPEPGSWALMGLGLAGLLLRQQRGRAQVIEGSGRESQGPSRRTP